MPLAAEDPCCRRVAGTRPALAKRMTLSRHTQVENLTNLLGARRAQARRDNAYLLLTASLLEMPVEDVSTRLKRSLPADQILSFPARATRVA